MHHALKTSYRLTANAVNARVRPHALIHPLFVIYHITHLCNLKCIYCEDFSSDKNSLYETGEPSTAEARKLLQILRKKFDYIYITGGEPYARADLEELMAFMDDTLQFKLISLNTNALTLDRKPEILKHIHNLVISLDTLNADRKNQLLRVKNGTSQKIFDNISWAIPLQKKYGFKISINCVIMPHTLADAREVMLYALENGLDFSCNPQNLGYTAHPALSSNPEYQKLISDILDLKKQNKTISGSRFFYENILNFSPFDCYPHLLTRVTPKGDLYWPCRPLNTFAGNILKTGSYDETVREGICKYGILNACKKNCRMRCYVESSLLVKHPLSLAAEFFKPRQEEGLYSPQVPDPVQPAHPTPAFPCALPANRE